MEKLLKAYLTSRGQDFEKTHDLRSLNELCAALDPKFLDQQDAVEPLTAYAVRFRYPGPSDPSAEEVWQALEIVDRAWQLVTSRLPRETIP